MDVHVVSKSNNSQHATFSLPGSSSQEETPLKPSSVRVRATLLGLASNNLTYALGGTRLHWWDAYPVPPTAPAPYNDSSEWGIVPAWGLASVIESSIPDLPAGTSLYGLWPTSAHVVDLELTPAVAADAAEAPGHWREVSSHRASLMPLYNQYRVFETHGKDLSEFGWDVTVGATMKAGYVLSEYVFTPDPVNHPPVHPLAESEQWTVEDADLSKTVFVSLAAATKTARSMAYNFFCRPRNTGPLAFLQVTSRPRDILEAAEKFIPQFPVGAIAYEDVVSSGAWIARLRPERVVVADFGARDGALNGIVKAIESTPELQSTKVTVLAVGNQQKVCCAAFIFRRDSIRANSNRSTLRRNSRLHESPSSLLTKSR